MSNPGNPEKPYNGNFDKPHKRFQEELGRRHQRELGKTTPGTPQHQYLQEQKQQAKKIIDEVNKRHPPKNPPGQPPPPTPPNKPPGRPSPPGAPGNPFGKLIRKGGYAQLGWHLGNRASEEFLRQFGQSPDLTDEEREQDALRKHRNDVYTQTQAPSYPFRGGQIPGQLYWVSWTIKTFNLYGDPLPTDYKNDNIGIIGPIEGIVSRITEYVSGKPYFSFGLKARGVTDWFGGSFEGWKVTRFIVTPVNLPPGQDDIDPPPEAPPLGTFNAVFDSFGSSPPPTLHWHFPPFESIYGNNNANETGPFVKALPGGGLDLPFAPPGKPDTTTDPDTEPPPDEIKPPDKKPFPFGFLVPTPTDTSGKPFKLPDTSTKTDAGTKTDTDTNTGTKTDTDTDTDTDTGIKTDTGTPLTTPYLPLAPKINAPNPTQNPTVKPINSSDPVPEPEKPKTPPPTQSPPGNDCKCNGPVMQKLNDLDKKLNPFDLVDLGLLTVINNKLGLQVSGGLSGWLQKFGRATRLDKAINALNLLLAIHNAAMLSRSLVDSISYLVDGFLNVIGLRDEEDNPLDIGDAIGDSISSVLQSVLGQETYQGLSENWKKLSAIYTAAVNIYELTLSSMAGIAEGLEIIGEYSGKMGNALKNRLVREEFRDLNPDELDPNISIPRQSLYWACLLKDNDNQAVTQMRYDLFYLDLRKARDMQTPVYGMPIPQAQAQRKYKPQIVFFFKEDEADVDPDYTAVEGRISYRLMKEESTTITKAELTTIANRIKPEFGTGNGYVWRKGKDLASYYDPKKGYDFRLLVRSKADAKEIIDKILDTNSDTPNWDKLSYKEADNPIGAYPTIPGNQIILGKTHKEPRIRPIAEVRFQYAYCDVHGLPNPIILYDRSFQSFNDLAD